ncbi:DUF1236 domain-containing protein [Mesorhizobium yinganensis]|uniref:DUF1236 domain-containing protein n=1 Tax=Mesorhizobium yinganensis TaxID=3157707 RepID=UPI0032B7FEA1
MKRISCIAAALLAGSALVALPALAQERASPDVQQPIIKDGGKSTEGKSSVGGKTSGATGNANRKATQAQPDQQPSDEGKAASEAKENTTKRKSASQDAAGESDTKTNKAANKETTDTAKRKATTENAARTTEPASKKDSKAAVQTEGQQGDQADSKTTTEATPGEEKQDEASGQQPSNETTASINITNEQKVEITNVIKEAKVEPVDVDFDVSVGVAVPTTIEILPLPPRIVEIVPAYRGFDYFVLADGRIIIVEPDTHKVVYILVA